MKTRELGRSGLTVSAVGLGCMGMSHAYGSPADKREMTELIGYAVDMGYTLFDTAECYGTAEEPHDNELLVGEALKPFRDKVVIASKFGVTFGEGHTLLTDSRPTTIRKAVEGSLRRLQTDRIDLYYQHRIDPQIEPETVAATMNELIKEGKILRWGISEATEDYLRRAHRVCKVAAVQNRYSMMARWHSRLFPVLEELGIGFVAFSPLANGILTDCYTAADKFDAKTDYRATMPQYSKDGFMQNEQLLTLIRTLAEAHHATPSQIALAWMMNRRECIVPIPGTRRLSRLKENFGATDIRMTEEEVRLIDRQLEQMPMSDVFGGMRQKP